MDGGDQTRFCPAKLFHRARPRIGRGRSVGSRRKQDTRFRFVFFAIDRAIVLPGIKRDLREQLLTADGVNDCLLSRTRREWPRRTRAVIVERRQRVLGAFRRRTRRETEFPRNSLPTSKRKPQNARCNAENTRRLSVIRANSC